MDIQSKLDRMQVVSGELAVLHVEIDARIVAAAKRYIDAYQGSGYGTPGDCATYDWDIAGHLVVVIWNETWAYGGEDGGGFEFPIRLIWDEPAMAEHERVTAESVAIETQEAAAELEKKERRELEELSRKYPKGA